MPWDHEAPLVDGWDPGSGINLDRRYTEVHTETYEGQGEQRYNSTGGWGHQGEAVQPWV